MISRFGLALVLLGFVLLGRSEAQRQQQNTGYQRQWHYVQGHNVHGRTNARPGSSFQRASTRSTAGAINGGGTTDVGSTDGPEAGGTPDNGAGLGPGPAGGLGPGPAGGLDCSKNQLASNNHDRFKKRS